MPSLNELLLLEQERSRRTRSSGIGDGRLVLPAWAAARLSGLACDQPLFPGYRSSMNYRHIARGSPAEYIDRLSQHLGLKVAGWYTARRAAFETTTSS